MQSGSKMGDPVNFVRNQKMKLGRKTVPGWHTFSLSLLSVSQKIVADFILKCHHKDFFLFLFFPSRKIRCKTGCGKPVTGKKVCFPCLRGILGGAGTTQVATVRGEARWEMVHLHGNKYIMQALRELPDEHNLEQLEREWLV